MFGYLRFFLAFLVMISHIGIRVYGLNPGVIAVVVFYLLAGFVVSHLFHDILPRGRYELFYFYRDRILRIFPLYLYVILLTLFFLLFTSFGEPNFTFKKMLYNLTIIPLNYYMYIDSTILTNPHWCLIPPAWSLGTELQAYILLSLVFLYKRVGILLSLVTFAVYIIANLSILQPDYFGYRFIIGVFFIFYTGSCIHKIVKNSAIRYERLFPLFILFAILIASVIFSYYHIFSPTYTKETFIGLVIGIPIVYLLSKTKIKLPLNHYLGSLSYGLFLSHFLSIWILQYINFDYHHNQVIYTATIFVMSLFTASLGIYFVENRFNHIRYIKNK